MFGGKAPLGAEEKTARAINAYAKYTCSNYFQMGNMN
jgi:hypothetical protein